MRGGEDPNISFVVDGYDGIVVRIGGHLVQQNGRAWYFTGFVIEVRYHVNEEPFSPSREFPIILEILF